MEIANRYSARWFEVFLQTIQPAQTEEELAFLCHQLPRPAHRRLLDVSCGSGRHAGPLGLLGYEVLGVDISPEALALARRQAPANVSYRKLDMRELGQLPGHYDGVLNLWQSFGYFDRATNREILRAMAERLRPGGRLILDVYQRAFFEAHQGTQLHERGGQRIVETKVVEAGRLTVQLSYGGGDEQDRYAWELYSDDELAAEAGACGLLPLLICTGFDERQPVVPSVPRMQLVFERAG